EHAVHIGDDRFGDISIEPCDLRRSQRHEPSRAIAPILAIAKQEEHDHESNEGSGDQSGEIAQSARSNRDYPAAGPLRVSGNDSSYVVLRYIHPVANKTKRALS